MSIDVTQASKRANRAIDDLKYYMQRMPPGPWSVDSSGDAVADDGVELVRDGRVYPIMAEWAVVARNGVEALIDRISELERVNAELRRQL